MTAELQQLAARIVSRFYDEKIVSAALIVGLGFVNQVYRVDTERRKAIVRLNQADSYAEYVKEKWCLEQAAAAGIPGPRVLAIGIEDGQAYMLQSFVEGENGLETAGADIRIWRRLGEYARVIHEIPVQGYGGELVDPVHGIFRNPPHPGSDGSWHGYIRYNIDSLTESDPLLGLGVITKTQSKQAKAIFGKLAAQTFRFGLIHCDLSAKNVLVDPEEQAEGEEDGAISLLDWGGAEVYPVPHGDVIQLMLMQFRDGTPDAEQFGAFAEGYRLSPEQLSEARELMLLRSFDTVRWAIDCAPEQTGKFAKWAKYSAGLVLDQTD